MMKKAKKPSTTKDSRKRDAGTNNDGPAKKLPSIDNKQTLQTKTGEKLLSTNASSSNPLSKDKKLASSSKTSCNNDVDGKVGILSIEKKLPANTTKNLEDNKSALSESGMVEFSLGPINSQLICSVCKGYYRDPYTTTCFHTFCKSCLFRGRPDSEGIYCPSCDTFLGADFSKIALFDRTLQEIIDKIIFPNLFKKDEDDERDFYFKRNTPLKPEFDKERNNSESDQESLPMKKKRASIDSAKEVKFTLKPADPCEMLSLDRPCLQTQSSITVGQIKKYLMKKLPENITDPSEIEILCNEVRLGKELSVLFILRTVWLESQQDLLLTYQRTKK